MGTNIYGLSGTFKGASNSSQDSTTFRAVERLNQNTTRKKTELAKPPELTAGLKVNSVYNNTENILNRYRSYTYNFTLAAVDKNHANNPENWRKSIQNYIILKSGGKGSSVISEENVIGQDVYKDQTVYRLKGPDSTEKTLVGTDISRGRKLVKAFNSSDSSGRFDFFIDNVEIDITMSAQKSGGFTLPTKIEFDVFEPYGIEGFIEALQVSAEAAGYENYVVASFVLLIDFIGYPDNQSLPKPVNINGSSRYFLIKFTGLGIEITEKGTKYHCTAVPYNEIGFGEAGKIKKPLSMKGSTVKQMLESLMASANARLRGDESIFKDTESDTYEIKFPVRKADGTWDYKDYDKTIADQGMADSVEGSKLVGMLDPSIASTSTVNLSSFLLSKETDGRIQFPENVNIHDIISATIRDSTYVRNLLETIGKGGNNPDKFGMIQYFLIKLEIENKSRTDPYKKRPYHVFRYVVTPHRVHYTFIPEYAQSEEIDRKILQTVVYRKYDYIYTGLNTDILNFKLDYNFLYFEAVPTALGRNRDNGAEDRAIGTDLKNEAQPGNIAVASNSALSGTVMPMAERTDMHPGGQLNTGQPTPDPYAAMAKNMHLALQNSVSRVTGDLEIIGDPFFLVTGGIGNYKPTPTSDQPGVTTDGEADTYYGQVLVQVNFKNPIDIGANGIMKFRPGISSTSGIFMVIQSKNSFKDGAFKQVLSLVRIPGELTDKNNATDPAQGNPTESRSPSQNSPTMTTQGNA